MTVKRELFERGDLLVGKFCFVNDLPEPDVTAVLKQDWFVDACAYYRPDEGIKVCLEECANPCGAAPARAWSWPGSSSDRTPFGVVAHELGHHVDWVTGEKKGRYYSEFGEQVMKAAGEKPLTSYCPNPAEHFAEMFRLYATNHALLKLLRRRTWRLLRERWEPVTGDDWLANLGEGVPERVVRALKNKMK